MAIVGSLLEISFWSVIVPVGILTAMQLFKTMFYTIGTMLFWVIDILQEIFRKLAGLEDVWVDGVATQGDILTSIFRSSIVVDTLIAVSVFAVALVIIGSIVQMVRTEYTTEGSKNSKESILGKALKSLIMFVLIPVVCFFGIRVSNYLLQAVDYATSSGGSQSLSGAIFNAATVDANRIANDKEGEFNITDISIASILSGLIGGDATTAHLKHSGSEYYVSRFSDTLKTSANSEAKARQVLGSKIDQLMAMKKSEAKKFNENGYGEGLVVLGEHLYYGNVSAVSYFYAMGSINMLVLYIGAYLVLQSLFNASMGLIVRMYKCTALFVLAPAAIGLQPLDDGAAYKKWRGGFISNVLAAYGVIVALNLFFTVSGIVTQISLWDPNNWATYGLNKFMQALFVVVGATQIKGLAKMVGDMIGAANAMEEGASAVGEVGKLAQGMGKMAGGIAKGGAFAVSAGKSFQARRMERAAKKDIKGIDDQINTVMSDRTKTKEQKDAEIKALGEKKAAATQRLDSAAAAKEINKGRMSGIWNDSGLGKTLGSVTGGVSSVLSGKAFKGYDDATKETLTKTRSAGIASAADTYTKSEAKNSMGSMGTAMAFATGGLSAIGNTLIHGFDDVISGVKNAKGAAKGQKFGAFVSGYDERSTSGKQYYLGKAIDTGVAKPGEKTDELSKTGAARTDAHKNAEDQYNLATQQNQAAKQQIIEDANARGGSLYRRQQLSFSNAFSGISGLANGASMSSADVVNMSARVQTLKTALAGNEGSEAYKFADSISKILSGISAGSGASPEQLQQIKSIVDGANAGYLSKEYATTLGAATETRTAIGEIHAKQAKIDTNKTDVDTDIETANNSDGVNEALQKFSEAMSRDAQESDRRLRDALEAAASAGITIKGTNGEPLKIDSKQFVDELKKVRQSVEDANAAKTQKEMAKTMQDLLKEFKKKK